MLLSPLFKDKAFFLLLAFLIISGVADTYLLPEQAYAAPFTKSANQAFEQASKESGVPGSILKALCYMEGHLSNHGGSPSIDDGYGCMHLVHSSRVDTLGSAAKDLSVSTDLLKTDLATNIRGGAAVLHDYALQFSPSHTLPKFLADWYSTIAAYSNASTPDVAHMYADGVYKLLNSGFSASTEKGETVTLAAQAVTAHVVATTRLLTRPMLPHGCKNDGKTDYPGAIDCMLNPKVYDCPIVSPGKSPNPCTYEDAKRPKAFPILFVGIHDIEGSVQDAINEFENIKSGSSTHYLVDTDGTVYQMVHDKDISYHIGNYWYNQHAIGIEHAGFDATGFQWYNAAEYLGSAKLVSYLLKKFNIPLDHDHILSHGTVPAQESRYAPNHVDPGPYWLWDYYFKLIHQQGIPYGKNAALSQHIVSLHPGTDQRPFRANEAETPDNFNFFYLYNGPSTRSGLIQHAGSDITDVTNNVEVGIGYHYLASMKDPAGTGYMLYKIWYGVRNYTHKPKIRNFESARLAWLAVPPGTGLAGRGALVTLNLAGANAAKVYGIPETNKHYQIGDAPNQSIFVSEFTVTENYKHKNKLWYEINYNHRQAWVPATEAKISDS